MQTTQTTQTMPPEVHALIEAVDNILGDFSQDRHGYGAAAKMLDWPTRAALALALHNLNRRIDHV